MRTALLLLPSLLLTACPDPTQTPIDATQGGIGASAPGAGAPGAGGPGMGGPGGSISIDLSMLTPGQTQDALKAGAHIMARGTIDGTCTGTVSLHAVGTSGGQASGPLTLLNLDATGPFEMALPASTAVRIIPHCDANKDGKIVAGSDGDSIAAPVDVTASATDIEGVKVDLSTQMSQGGPPPGEGGVGGAPPAGGAAGGGAPPAGGGAPPAGGGAPPAGGGAPPAGGGAPPAGGTPQ